jgi:prepilin-type N-terminal cleavage/methylation domain-containing protein
MILPIGRNKGFTLIELLLVIIILSLLFLSLLPRFSSTFASLELKSTAKKIIGVVKYAQEQAITEGVTLEFFFSNEERIYGITYEGQHKPIKRYKIPNRIFIEQMNDSGKIQSNSKIKLYPEGRVDKASIRVYNKKGQDLTISIAVTGKITIL